MNPGLKTLAAALALAAACDAAVAPASAQFLGFPWQKHDAPAPPPSPAEPAKDETLPPPVMNDVQRTQLPSPVSVPLPRAKPRSQRGARGEEVAGVPAKPAGAGATGATNTPASDIAAASALLAPPGTAFAAPVTSQVSPADAPPSAIMGASISSSPAMPTATGLPYGTAMPSASAAQEAGASSRASIQSRTSAATMPILLASPPSAEAESPAAVPAPTAGRSGSAGPAASGFLAGGGFYGAGTPRVAPTAPAAAASAGREASPAVSPMLATSVSVAATSAAAAAPAAAAAGKPELASVNTGQQIRITNNSPAKVKTIAIVPLKGAGGPYNLVENLDAFKAATAALPAKGGCVYSIRGQFADGSPLSVNNVDLCSDPLINITVW